MEIDANIRVLSYILYFILLRHNFGNHFIKLYVPENKLIYLVGGEFGNNFKLYSEKKITTLRT